MISLRLKRSSQWWLSMIPKKAGRCGEMSPRPSTSVSATLLDAAEDGTDLLSDRYDTGYIARDPPCDLQPRSCSHQRPTGWRQGDLYLHWRLMGPLARKRRARVLDRREAASYWSEQAHCLAMGGGEGGAEEYVHGLAYILTVYRHDSPRDRHPSVDVVRTYWLSIRYAGL